MSSSFSDTRTSRTRMLHGLEESVVQQIDEGFTVRVETNTREECEFVEVDFEIVTGDYGDGGKIFRKRR